MHQNSVRGFDLNSHKRLRLMAAAMATISVSTASQMAVCRRGPAEKGRSGPVFMGRTKYIFSGDSLSRYFKQSSITALEDKGFTTASGSGGKKSAPKKPAISALLTEVATETLVREQFLV